MVIHDGEDHESTIIALTLCIYIAILKLVHKLDFYCVVYLRQINDATFTVNGGLAAHRVSVTCQIHKKMSDFDSAEQEIQVFRC